MGTTVAYFRPIKGSSSSITTKTTTKTTSNNRGKEQVKSERTDKGAEAFLFFNRIGEGFYSAMIAQAGSFLPGRVIS